MAKYVSVQVPILAGSTATGPAIKDSGTTDAAVAGKLDSKWSKLSYLQ